MRKLGEYDLNMFATRSNSWYQIGKTVLAYAAAALLVAVTIFILHRV